MKGQYDFGYTGQYCTFELLMRTSYKFNLVKVVVTSLCAKTVDGGPNRVLFKDIEHLAELYRKGCWSTSQPCSAAQAQGLPNVAIIVPTKL